MSVASLFRDWETGVLYVFMPSEKGTLVSCDELSLLTCIPAPKAAHLFTSFINIHYISCSGRTIFLVGPVTKKLPATGHTPDPWKSLGLSSCLMYFNWNEWVLYPDVFCKKINGRISNSEPTCSSLMWLDWPVHPWILFLIFSNIRITGNVTP